MSKSITALVAILISLIKSQIYEDCGSAEIITGYTLSIGRDMDNEMIEITIQNTATSNRWFGYGFGTNSMNNAYAIIYEEDDNGDLTGTEWKLSCCSSPPGTTLTSSATNITAANNILTFERPYSVSNNGYDFTELMTCAAKTVKIVAAVGRSSDGLTLDSKHQTAKSGGTFTRTCKCPTTDPTMDPTSDPTMEPTTAMPTMQPTTSEPTTAKPTLPPAETAGPTTMAPSMNPTTLAPVTAVPTTAMPTTGAPTEEGYEECVEATEIISGITVAIGRRESDETMEITITGKVDQYSAFGFGASVMDGTYAIIVTGEETSDVMERTLGDHNEGSELTGNDRSFTSAESNTIDGSTQTVVIRRPYSSGDTYDFTDLLTCEVDSIAAISAQGPSYTFEYHETREIGTLTRSCNCDGSGGSTPSPVDVDNSSANSIFNILYTGFVLVFSLFFI